jgi:penicillin-binding protein 1C
VNIRRKLVAAAGGIVALVSIGWAAGEALDRAFPPPLPERIEISREVVDRDGMLLRAFAMPDGRWRLATSLDRVDPRFLEMLIAYEDKRFRDHIGVDALALLRAAGQLASNGRIVSGGSTLSMQLARLIEPRQSRSLGRKLRQIARALQIERRLSKDEILAEYLTLAPYGGNLEGVRAASLAWFGKEPKRLTVAEAALLVALPQLPEKRRPDRNAAAARDARDRVLARAVEAGVLDEREAARAALEPVPAVRLAMPALAPHAAETAIRNHPEATSLQLTLSRKVQEGLEAVARDGARKSGDRVSVAMVLADAMTGEILGEVGSAGYFDARRS